MDYLRELAYLELDSEPPKDANEENLMSDDDFEQEREMAAEGRWEELGLDPMPEAWEPVTIEDLKNAAG